MKMAIRSTRFLKALHPRSEARSCLQTSRARVSTAARAQAIRWRKVLSMKSKRAHHPKALQGANPVSVIRRHARPPELVDADALAESQQHPHDPRRPGMPCKVTDMGRPDWCLLGAIGVLASSGCYATYERASAAASARDWPKAESELWRFIQGPDCVSRTPTLQCKQAYALLGDVLLEDNRPFLAANILQLGRAIFYRRQVGDAATNRDLDRRIADGLTGAKQRWDQFRGPGAGQCRIVTRYAGPGGRSRLDFLWTELDLGQATRVTTAVDGAPLFDSMTEAGLHAVTIHASYADPSSPGVHRQIETTHFRACAPSEQIEVLFQVREKAPGTFAIDPLTKGGNEPPLEGPMRPLRPGSIGL